MRKLSCKIFNEFYIPELSKKEMDGYGAFHKPNKDFTVRWHSDMRVWERNQDKPFDLDSQRNEKYYPAHPQMRLLTGILRDYGLFRDEHRDFNEAMKAVAVSRGKVFREVRGPHDKNKKKKV